ncbi:MAG: MFS transporter [Rhizobiales bacterium]|nr:MFS transporter [Hyphomicrobiales bacterium]
MKSTATILGMFAFGYFLAVIFRSVNALIAPNLVSDIGLDATMLGLLTSALLIAHGASQIPIGVALDRYGPRRVQAAMLCCAALGSSLFAVGTDALTLTIARALIGAGFAGALMSGFKAVTMSVPGPRQALGNAIVMGGGQIGYIIATWPTEVMVGMVGWRPIFAGLAVLTLFASALYLLIVPEWPSPGPPQKKRDLLAGLRNVFADPVVWRIAPLVWVTAGFNIAMLTLWAGPWFRDVAGYDRGAVATGLLINATAAAGGVFICGWIADRAQRRGIGLLSVMQTLLLVFLVVQIPIILGHTVLTPVAWFIFAGTGQAGILSYPWLAAHFGKGTSSRAQTGVNTGIFVLAFAVQYAAGAVIDLFDPTPGGGYEPVAYQVSFACVFVLEVAALVWFMSGRKMLEARYQKRAGSQTGAG